MTYEEAEEEFKAIMTEEIERIPSHYDEEVNDIVYDDMDRIEKLLELNKIFNEAVRKQIPKKPICIDDRMWSCPTCGNTLLNKRAEYPTKLTPTSAGLPHCLSCGQAIDWNEVE